MALNGSDETVRSPRDPGWRLFERLPEFYRESPELLSPLVGAAEDLLGHIQGEFERAEREVASARLVGPLPRGEAGFSSTTGGLIQLLEEEVGSAPRVWNGLQAVQHPAGGLLFRRAACRSAVAAWEKERLSALPGGFLLRGDLLPPGVQIFFVALGRLPERWAPRVGERFAGEVLRIGRGNAAGELAQWA